MSETKVRALIIAHDARAPGGVNNFLRIMRRRIRRRIDASRFANGRRHGETGKLQTLKRLLWDYVRFCVLMVRRKFDVVHLNPSLDMASMPRELVFVWLATLFRPSAKVLVFYRGWDWNALSAVKASGVKRKLFLATHRHIDRVLVLSTEFKQALVEMGVDGEKIFTHTTMFEGEVLGPALEAHQEKNWSQLLFMCRFVPAKGGRETLDAFADVLKRYPAAKLVMAGDGPERQALEEQAGRLGLGESVTFTGYVGGMRKMRLLAESGVFLLPTRHPEGMPNAILEAMAAGAVVISTPIGGIPDVLIDGENGVIMPGVETPALISAIETYLNDEAYARATGERNRAKAWATWESEVVSNRVADHYEALAQRSASSPKVRLEAAEAAAGA